MKLAQEILDKGKYFKDFGTLPEARKQVAELVNRFGADKTYQMLEKLGLKQDEIFKIMDKSIYDAEVALGGGKIPLKGNYEEIKDYVNNLPDFEKKRFTDIIQQEQNRLYGIRSELGGDTMNEAGQNALQKLIADNAKAIEKAGGLEAWQKQRAKTDIGIRGGSSAVKKFADEKIDLSKQSPLDALSTLLKTVDVASGAAPLRSAVSAALSGENIGEAASQTFKGQREGAEGREIAKKLLSQMANRGLVPQPARVMNEETGEMEEKFPLEAPLGIAADVALDPTNLIPGGQAKSATKLGMKVDEARKLIDLLLNSSVKAGDKALDAEKIMQRARVAGSKNPLLAVDSLNTAAMELKYGKPADTEDMLHKIYNAYPQLQGKAKIEPVNFSNPKDVRGFLDRNLDELGENVDNVRKKMLLGQGEGFQLGNLAAVNTNSRTPNNLFSTFGHEAEHLKDSIVNPDFKSKPYDMSKLKSGNVEDLKATTSGHHMDADNFELDNTTKIINEILKRGK